MAEKQLVFGWKSRRAAAKKLMDGEYGKLKDRDWRAKVSPIVKSETGTEHAIRTMRV
jgi:hypothetical protein